MKIFFTWRVNDDFMRVGDGVFIGYNTHLPARLARCAIAYSIGFVWREMFIPRTKWALVTLWHGVIHLIRTILSPICNDHPSARRNVWNIFCHTIKISKKEINVISHYYKMFKYPHYFVQ